MFWIRPGNCVKNEDLTPLSFDPKTSGFWSAGNKIFKFEDLMFSAEQCVETIENLFID